MRRRDEDEPENLDRWLISYADFITLMFTFFAALYALSSVDKAKMAEFSGSLNETFKVIEKPIPQMDNQKIVLMEDIKKATGDLQGITVRNEPRGVVVTFSDSVLFASGSAELKPEIFAVLEKLSKLLSTVPGKIAIEGHTDNVPISSSKYSSNWELSTARAASMLHFFIEKGIDPANYSIAGYAEFRPLASNATEEGRQKNRRVEIVIAK
ncbi:MAG TPA: flagellar motor protein MotB [Dissulfurispiraceae bacterium]|nr:flagellar motor protein MotB [Dissulfurispiraceae bacterium]